jgi:PAS domain S-box-containing protein
MPCNKPPPLAETSTRDEERAHLENLLDEALDESFPASDPVAVQFEAEMSPDSAANLSEAVVRAILATRSDAIIAADKSGIIRFWNPGAERVFGFRSAEAIGQSLDIIIPERLRQRHWEGYDRTMKTGRTRYGEGDTLAVPAVREDSEQISIEFTVALLQDRSGQLLGIAAILRDVTKRYEQIRALKQQLGVTRIIGSENP